MARRIPNAATVLALVASVAALMPLPRGVWGQAATSPSPATLPAEDPEAVLNGLGLNRDLKKKTLPIPKGSWQKLIDQPYFKDRPDLKADRLLFHGQYEESEILAGDLLKKSDLPDDRRQALIQTRLEAILNEGGDANIQRFESQVALLTTTQQAAPRIIRLRAQAMLQTGRTADAMALLQAFVDAHQTLPMNDANMFALFNMYGHTLELRAQYTDAIAVYGRIADFASRDLPEDPALRTEVAKACLRHDILSDTQGDGLSKRARQSAQAAFSAVLAIDGTYWPAQLESARLLFDTQNLQDAMKAANLVVDLNPYNVDVRILMVDAFIRQYDFDHAAAVLNDLKIIDETPLVQAYEGRLLLKERDPDAAIIQLQRALARNPSLLEARGWLAAAYYLRDQTDNEQRQLQAVKTIDRTPHPIALYQAGEVLRDARQYPEAQKLFTSASDQAAWWGAPYLSLAQLYLELGRLQDAQTAYDKGFKLDDYGLKTINQLRLLQFLVSRDTIETPHFIIRYQGPAKPKPKPADDGLALELPADPSAETANDQVLAQLIAVWAEKIYTDVTGDFQFQPPDKTTIEIFPSHEEFAVRITGMSQIGTVGASTGNVIALDAPRTGKDLNGNYDWARVIRHEFTHTVTLGLTRNRIPHWLTEAAAVHEEQAPRDWDTCRSLDTNYRAGTLFKFDELTFGFIRPKKPSDRPLAYAESEWVYSYLLDTYGQDKMLDFLHCFRDGKSEPDAYQIAFGKPYQTINQEFLTWAAGQLVSWGLPTTPLPSLADAKAAAAKDPANNDVQETLVSVLLNANQTAAAETVVRDILKRAPSSVQGRGELAAILSATHKPAEANKILDDLAKDAPDQPIVARLMGQRAVAGKDYDQAAQWYEKLEKLLPLDDSAYRALAGIYLSRNDNKDAIIQLEKLAAHEQKDGRIPRRLAELLMEEHQLTEARDYAYRAIRIDPYNALNHSVMAQVLMAAGQPKDAVAYLTYATNLEPRTADFWASLADASAAAGDKPAAAAAAKKAVDIDPKSPAKKWLP